MYSVAHTQDQLVDGTLPGDCPQEPCSTWGFDVVGHIEPAGEYLAAIEHNRDLSRRLLDNDQGDLEPDALDHERFFEDMLCFARSGDERVYEQEQGFAPLVLEPGFERDADGAWHINADAKAAASLEQRSLSTDIDMPNVVQRRRHWRDMGPDEQRALSYGFEAESHGLFDPDALAGHVNEALPRQTGLDGVTVEELEDLLGEQGACDYLAHLYEMVEHQLQQIERAAAHASLVASRNPVAQATTADGRTVNIWLRRTKRGDQHYGLNTRRWRAQAEARKASLALRGPLPEPEPGPLPGRTELPEDPAWRVTYGPMIVDQLKAWYPTLEYGSDVWKDAARRVYHSLKQGRCPTPPAKRWVPEQEVKRNSSAAVAPALPPRAPNPCRCDKHEPCPIHRMDKAPRLVARERYEQQRLALQAEIDAERATR